MSSGISSGNISFGGLVSGLDSKSIIQQLVSIKQQQLLNPINKKLSNYKLTNAALSPVLDILTNLRSTAKTLQDTTLGSFNSKTSVSSETSRVLVNATNASLANIGTYKITEVSQLAQPDVVVFDGVANINTTTFGTGTFNITYKGSTTSITIDSGENTLQGISDAINSADAGVKATIINDGSGTTPYRLFLTSEDTGDDTTITQNIDSILSLTVDAVSSAAAANEAASASFKVNGVAMTSETNQVTEAIPGVTFTLLQTNTTDTTTITVKKDTTAIGSRISSFITAYSTARNALRNAVLPDSETSLLGPLGHDIALTSANINISGFMGKILQSLAGHSYKSLAEIGIAANVDGDLTIDSGKLTAALENNISDVQLLFQGTTTEDGIAESVYKYVDSLVKPSGLFDNRAQQQVLEKQRLDKELDQKTDVINKYKLLLTQQFTRLEKVLAQLKNQGAALDSYSSVFSNGSNLLR